MKDLSENEIAEVREIFNKYDLNENNSINWDEFCKMVDDLDDHVTMNEKAVAFDKVDTNILA